MHCRCCFPLSYNVYHSHKDCLVFLCFILLTWLAPKLSCWLTSDHWGPWGVPFFYTLFLDDIKFHGFQTTLGWQHLALSFHTATFSSHSVLHCWLLLWHFCLDRASVSDTQHGQDQTSCLSTQALLSLHTHHFCRVWLLPPCPVGLRTLPSLTPFISHIPFIAKDFHVFL